MPKWILKADDGKKYEYNVTHFKKDRNNVVLSFSVQYPDGIEVYTLAPKHYHKHVSKVVNNSLEAISDTIGFGSGYKLASARGVIVGLTGGLAGSVVGHIAKSVLENFFEGDVDDGDYYNSSGALVFHGLIDVN